jgi:hypothetical protein
MKFALEYAGGIIGPKETEETAGGRRMHNEDHSNSNS